MQKDVAETVENTKAECNNKMETDLNNVQKDVAEAESNNKMETDLNNVQKDVAEAKSNNKMETDLNNVQKKLGETVEPSDENSVDNIDVQILFQ